jgi:hypothetical protein
MKKYAYNYRKIQQNSHVIAQNTLGSSLHVNSDPKEIIMAMTEVTQASHMNLWNKHIFLRPYPHTCFKSCPPKSKFYVTTS